jgi:hypothetical protein
MKNYKIETHIEMLEGIKKIYESKGAKTAYDLGQNSMTDIINIMESDGEIDGVNRCDLIVFPYVGGEGEKVKLEILPAEMLKKWVDARKYSGVYPMNNTTYDMAAVKTDVVVDGETSTMVISLHLLGEDMEIGNLEAKIRELKEKLENK